MKAPSLRVYAFAYLIFLYAPIILLPIFAFNDSKVVAFPLTGFTLDWFVKLWNHRAMMEGLWNSIIIGLGVVAAVMVIAGHPPWEGRTVITLSQTHGLHIGDVVAPVERAADAADEVDALVGAGIVDAEQRRQDVVLQDGDVQAADGVGLVDDVCLGVQVVRLPGR